VRSLLFGVLLSVGCGYQSWPLTRAPQLSGKAAGSVEVGHAGPRGRPIEVRLFHLEEPAAIVAGARSYVVWLYPDAGKPQNLGALALTISGDARTSNGLLRAHTSYPDFRISVTPEQDAGIPAPLHQSVFWANVEPR
jgi:hypothetical protein